MDNRLYTAAETRSLDVAAMDSGIPGMALMERAGEAVVRCIQGRWPQWRELRVGVLAGGGNNGGDGYVVARRLLETGVRASVVAASLPEDLAGDAAEAFARWQRAGGGWVGPEVPLDGFDLLVDALLGTGLDREVRTPYRELIERAADAPAPVVAVDIPSGLNADSGRVMGVAVPAVATVTFVGSKRGLFTGDGPDYTGEVVFDGLGIPEEVRSAVTARGRRVDPGDLGLAPRMANSHKGDYGKVAILGGAPGMAGAAAMAARAAVRGGSGWVVCCTGPGERVSVAGLWPEVITAEWDEEGELPEWLLDSVDVVALGPGLGRSAGARKLLKKVLEWAGSLVLDADALNLLAEDPGLALDLPPRNGSLILTPHPGEAARLLGSSPAEVQADRFEAATRIAREFQAICCLKGAGTVIARPGGEYAVNSSGGPALAQAGQGDILTGLLAARLGQEADPVRAAERGVWAHGAAGDRLAERSGPFGLTPTECADELPAVWARLQGGGVSINNKREQRCPRHATS